MGNQNAIAVMAAIIYAHDSTQDTKTVAEIAISLFADVDLAYSKLAQQQQAKAGQQTSSSQPTSSTPTSTVK